MTVKRLEFQFVTFARLLALKHTCNCAVMNIIRCVSKRLQAPIFIPVIDFPVQVSDKPKGIAVGAAKECVHTVSRVLSFPFFFFFFYALKTLQRAENDDAGTVGERKKKEKGKREGERERGEEGGEE